MKITIFQAVRLYDALSALSQQRLPFASARAVALTRQALAPERELLVQEEVKLVQALGGMVSGGSVRFDSDENAAQFRAAQDELRGQEIDVDLPALSLPNSAQLTPDEYEALTCILEE